VSIFFRCAWILMERTAMTIDTKQAYDSAVVPRSAPPVMSCGFVFLDEDGTLDPYAAAHQDRLLQNNEILKLHTLVQSLSSDLDITSVENKKLYLLSQHLQGETAKWKKEAVRFRSYLQAILHIDQLDFQFAGEGGSPSEEVSFYQLAASHRIDRHALRACLAHLLTHPHDSQHFAGRTFHDMEGHSPQPYSSGNTSKTGEPLDSFPMDDFAPHDSVWLGVPPADNLKGPALVNQCTTPCDHDRMYWKHLRTKAAQRHMVCTFCGHKWRQQTSPARNYFPKPLSPLPSHLSSPQPMRLSHGTPEAPPPNAQDCPHRPHESGRFSASPPCEGPPLSYPICVSRKPRRASEEFRSPLMGVTPIEATSRD